MIYEDQSHFTHNSIVQLEPGEEGNGKAGKSKQWDKMWLESASVMDVDVFMLKVWGNERRMKEMCYCAGAQGRKAVWNRKLVSLGLLSSLVTLTFDLPACTVWITSRVTLGSTESERTLLFLNLYFVLCSFTLEWQLAILGHKMMWLHQVIYSYICVYTHTNGCSFSQLLT